MSGQEPNDVVLKLLHTADWHLGHRFPSFDPDDQKKLMRARLEVIDRIVDLAERSGVDAVLCAGDLFDDPRPEKEWYEGLAKSLARGKASRPIFLLPGNHDPLLVDSVYSPTHPFRRLLSPWVHVVDRDGFAFALGEEAILYAAPCRSQAGQDDLALSLPERESGDTRLRIGLVHGMTFDLDNHQMNFPISKEAAVRRGFDYLAIGDTHSFREVEPSAPVPTVYPGAPEATNFGEDEPGYVAIVLLPRPGRRAIPRKERVGRWRWREILCSDLGALRSLRDSEDLRQCVLRLSFDLAVTVSEMAEVEGIMAELKGTDAVYGRVGVLQVDRTGLRLVPKLKPDDFPAELPAALKEAVALLRARTEDPEQTAVATRALYHLWKLVHVGS